MTIEVRELVIRASVAGPDGDAISAAALANKSSPDLTHARTVVAGDTLPAMCVRIYGDSKYYLGVAAYNGLSQFRKLAPGSTLVFPPLEK